MNIVRSKTIRENNKDLKDVIMVILNQNSFTY